MFASLAEKLQQTMRRLKGKGKLSEQDVDSALREIRLALLEADVNFKVVKDFIAAVRERAVGREVMNSLTPGQQVVKIVNEEMAALMGAERSEIVSVSGRPTVIMLAGLQGSGKTTTAVKLALQMRREGRNPLLVAADTYRPGAIRQLEILANETGIKCHASPDDKPVKICKSGLDMAQRESFDRVIIDTAGRNQVDEALMSELAEIKAAVKPDEILLIVDAMAGQEAVNTAVSFHELVGLSGIVLTKLDGDARGGAALSVQAVTGCPIKFVGTGEKIDALEPFHPGRMASRILGMGDVLSLIEKAEAVVNQEKAREMEQKLRRQQFTLADFREQLAQLRDMGPLEDILGMLPAGAVPKEIKQLSLDDKHFARVEAIISSMTKHERRNPAILNSSRRRRIAGGSGTSVQEVNRLLNQFSQMQKMFKKIGAPGGKGGFKQLKKGLPFLS